MKKNATVGIILCCLISACSTVPTKAKLSLEQTLTNEGFVQSKKDNFVVRVSKVDTSSTNYKDIAKYGLPVRIIVANLTDKTIHFGPNDIKIYKNNHEVSPLTATRIDQIKDRQKTKNAAWGLLNGALAITVGIVGATSGDTSLAQTTQQYAVDSINYTTQSHTATQQKTEDSMNALSTQLNSTLLQETDIQPKKIADGIVFF